MGSCITKCYNCLQYRHSHDATYTRIPEEYSTVTNNKKIHSYVPHLCNYCGGTHLTKDCFSSI